MARDPEIKAMQTIDRVLRVLSPEAKQRVVSWLNEKAAGPVANGGDSGDVHASN